MTIETVSTVCRVFLIKARWSKSKSLFQNTMTGFLSDPGGGTHFFMRSGGSEEKNFTLHYNCKLHANDKETVLIYSHPPPPPFPIITIPEYNPSLKAFRNNMVLNSLRCFKFLYSFRSVYRSQWSKASNHLCSSTAKERIVYSDLTVSEIYPIWEIEINT